MEIVVDILSTIVGLVVFALFIGLPVTYIRLGIKHVQMDAEDRNRVNLNYTYHDYGKYVREPKNLPKKYNFKRSFASKVLSLFFTVFFGILWGYAVVKGIQTGGRDGLFLVFGGSLTFGLVFFVSLYNMYRRTFFKEAFYVVITDQDIQHDHAKIPYRAITRIYYSVERAAAGKSKKIRRYINFDSTTDFIRIELSSLEDEQWEEIINCCLYHNPSIVIDTKVLEYIAEDE